MTMIRSIAFWWRQWLGQRGEWGERRVQQYKYNRNNLGIVGVCALAMKLNTNVFI
jgi:hypothetical protein